MSQDNAAYVPESVDAAEATPALFDSVQPEELTEMAVGALVAGRFRVGRMLGRGGHGAVYEAVHVVLDYPVAIKVLHAAYGRDPLRRARFRREALLGARLRHRNIVSIHDAGELADGSPFLVLEHVDGEDLAILIARARLDAAATVEVGVQLLAAVCALFDRGVIHRDIKPSNVMIQRAVDGYREVKLLDFGISKAMEAELKLKTLTADDCVLGTPQYMSPEQVTGGAVDVRSDLYSVGAVLYECITGEPPYDAPTPGGVLAMILTTDARPVRELRPEVPQALADLIDRAVKKVPEDRWSSPTEMSEALRALVLPLGLPIGADAWRSLSIEPAAPIETGAFALMRPRSSAVPSVPSAADREAAEEARQRPTITASIPREAPRRRAWLAVALAATMALGGAMFWLWSADAPTTSELLGIASDDSSANGKVEEALERELAAGEAPELVELSTGQARAGSLDPADLERRARSAFLARRGMEAVSLFRRATEIDPARASAWRGLGLAAATAGDHGTSEHALRRYLVLAPEASDRVAIEQRLTTLGGEAER